MTADPVLIERLVEALLFASAEPLDEAALAARLPAGADVRAALAALSERYRYRGVALANVAKGWAFRTAPDLGSYLTITVETPKKPTRAALETLAIIAYHQPVTRAEIEAVRGVGLSSGTLDTLLEAGWVRPGPRRDTPGRPLTWLTTDRFLDQFALASLADLPGIDELRAAGLLDSRPAIATLPGGREDAAASPGQEDADITEE